MGRAQIRFDLNFIPASIIAEQWYCEKAVELQYRHPGIEFTSPELTYGTSIHELFASETEELTEKEIKELIKSGKPASFREIRFEGVYRGVRIKGIPDYFSIKGGKALFLLDYKFSKHKRIFPSHRIQVDTYGFLLHKNYLDTNNLICGIVIVEPEMKELEDVCDDITPLLQAEALKMRQRRLERTNIEGRGLYGQLYSYSLDNTKKNLDWAIGYWKKQRAALPTRKAHKCEACQFNAVGLCKSALTAASTKKKW
ncbi:MAG: PD-(D/E)XK nuclease family protein [Candidatus Aminicenantales bacterium]|jgi:hypothetical protein